MRMNKIHRSTLSVTAVFVAMIVAILMTTRISSAQTKGKIASEIHVCSLLTADDVAPIVGVKQLSQETKGGTTCMWGDPGNDPAKLRLLIQAPTFTQTDVDPVEGAVTPNRERMEASFKANRKQAFDDKNSHAKDELQLGKTAFSALTDDGVEIIILKKSRLLNIHYMTGKLGTPENIEAIRKVAAKVAASF